MDEKTVWVRRQYNDDQSAKYYLKNVSGIKWDKISGGVNAIAPNWSLYGYVNCQGMIEGDVAHSGIHGSCPHNIKICILKIDNTIEIIKEIIDKVGPQPRKFSASRKHTCITDITDILKDTDKPQVRSVLLDELERRGHSETSMAAAIKKHSDIIIKSRWEEDKRQFAYKLKK